MKILVLLVVVVISGLAHASDIERKRIISAAIQEVHSEEQIAVITQRHEEGTSDQLLQAFKHASKESVQQGERRVKFEKIIHRAEMNILNAETSTHRTSTGSVLTKEEVEMIYQETECEEQDVDCSPLQMREFRTISGVCNNLRRPLLGSTNTPFRRLWPAQYEDGMNRMRGTGQSMAMNEAPFLPLNPSPRIISSQVVEDRLSFSENFTHMLMQWGQFLDHDLDLAPAFKEPPCTGCNVTEKCGSIRIPKNDSTFGDPSQAVNCHPFQRSIPTCNPRAKSGIAEPREQINELTSFIDGSQVYGSTDAVFNAVRNGNTVFLRTGPNIPGKVVPYRYNYAYKCYTAYDFQSTLRPHTCNPLQVL